MSQTLRSLRQPPTWMALLSVIAFYGIFSVESRAQFPTLPVNICVKDDQGQAVAGARVSIEGPSKTEWATEPQTGCVNKERQFNLKETYKLTVEAPGYEAHEQSLSLPNKGMSAVEQAVTLKKKQTPSQGNQGNQGSGDTGGDEGPREPQSGIFSRARAAAAEFISNYWLTGLVSLTALASLGAGWMSGYRLELYRLGAPAPTIAQQVQTIVEGAISNMAFNLQLLKSGQEKIGQQQDNILQKLDKIQNTEMRSVSLEPELAGQSFSSVASQERVTKQSHAPDALFKSPSFQESAQSAYRNLKQGLAVFPAPVYLNTEVNNSPMDMLGDSKVYLQEVGGMQGTFVLFKGGDDQGCVFPNPNLKFRQQALKLVFPNLTEAQFLNDTENIKPVPVSRLDGDRWKVEFKQ